MKKGCFELRIFLVLSNHFLKLVNKVQHPDVFLIVTGVFLGALLVVSQVNIVNALKKNILTLRQSSTYH